MGKVINHLKKYIWNLLSSSEHIITYVLFSTSIIYQNTYSFSLFIASILKIVLAYYPKKAAKHWEIGKRPKGAIDCNAWNCGGRPKTGGIVSGHVISITMFSTLLILSLQVINAMNIKKWIGFLFVIFTTSISRYYKSCHTIFQIILGLGVGVGLGHLLFFIQNKLDNFERFKKDRKDILTIFL